MTEEMQISAELLKAQAHLEYWTRLRARLEYLQKNNLPMTPDLESFMASDPALGDTSGVTTRYDAFGANPRMVCAPHHAGSAYEVRCRQHAQQMGVGFAIEPN